MNNFLEDLKKYLVQTPAQERKAAWERQTQTKNVVSPTVEQFLLSASMPILSSQSSKYTTYQFISEHSQLFSADASLPYTCA
ncbi:hypothetical protein [Hugenholtzia roseola]|uniref:hypothetical protein n=1 Tax=Hugenholtzia roseola TaxID=1002 RepID=UPI0004034E3D|nr:hypothetical protein [Hugenholtzia roseola]